MSLDNIALEYISKSIIGILHKTLSFNLFTIFVLRKLYIS